MVINHFIKKNARSLKGSFNRWPVFPSSYSDVWTKERIDIIFLVPCVVWIVGFVSIYSCQKER